MIQLDDILAIGGKPGLFQLVKATRQGVLVESLLDGKRMPVSQRADVSALKDIAIYTYGEEVPLGQVYFNIQQKEKGGACIDPKGKSNDELKDYMLEVLPEFDQERVYPSHLKKLFAWYNLLHEKGLLKVSLEEQTEEPSEESE